MRANIALYGRSGSGKTEVAEYLASKHGYVRCNTGAACRQICRILFQSESKTILNQVTDAMRAIDERVWLRVALSHAPKDQPVVLDSMRFQNDYDYLKQAGFSLWRITAPLNVRVERLKSRGQDFDPVQDDSHPAESELERSKFDYDIDNESLSMTELHKRIDLLVETLTS